MAGTGHISYDDAHDDKYGQYEVPIERATAENIAPYGRLVRDFRSEECWITPWPVSGWRPLAPGTGDRGGVVETLVNFRWDSDQVHAFVETTGGHKVMGRLPADVTSDNKTHVLVRETNYHPDSGQVFYPAKGEPFVALLALPGDNLRLEDFRAFLFDEGFGLQIRAGVWHQVIPAGEQVLIEGKQGAMHACVMADFAHEFGKFLRVPLRMP